MPPVLHRHTKDCGYRRPHRQIPPEIWRQSCSVGTLCSSFIKRQHLLPFLFAATIPPDIQHRTGTDMRLLIISLALSLLAGCAQNQVTGQNDFVMMSESQEIAIGRQYNEQVISKQYQVYDIIT